MSRMRIVKSEDERMTESREMIRSKMMESIDFTIYEHEYGKIYSVLKDAVVHIATKRGISLGEQIVYAKSACYFSALLITHLIGVDVEEAMILALGSYIEQEAKKKDQWRDESFNQLYKHLRDEIAEIANSEGVTIRLHNCIDACALSAMLGLILESY